MNVRQSNSGTIAQECALLSTIFVVGGAPKGTPTSLVYQGLRKSHLPNDALCVSSVSDADSPTALVHFVGFRDDVA